MTEYEINKAVADKLCVTEAYATFTPNGRHSFDPCNNAQQACEIMLANNISVVELSGSYEAYHNLVVNSFDDCEYDLVSMHEKPFVAAMLLFLEI